MVSFVRQIDGPVGNLVGVVGTDISLKELTAIVSRVHFGKTGYLMLVEDTGSVIADSNNPTHNFKGLGSLGEEYRVIAQANDGLHQIDMGGIPFDCVVFTSPELGWKYVGLIPHAEMMSGANRLTVTLIVIAIIMTGGAVCLTLVFGRRFTRPLNRVADCLESIASGDGDLTKRLAINSRDEVGAIAEHFNQFVENLGAVMGTVRRNSRELRLAAAEIATGNADLSARTEQQAAALQQTAASMDELTAAVTGNAESPRRANAMAVEACATVNRASTAVRDLLETIQTISSDSAKIADITGLIEGIAFQTNILALNAAVEAARAGEQGRGFSDVASEVRSVAQRSAVAAKEIKELIQTSVNQIEYGSSLATLVGATISEVTAAVKKVGATVAETTEASNEQSRRISEVNRAIAQIDDVTQQNAALMEEAASAATALREQGRQLDELVARFRIQDETHA